MTDISDYQSVYKMSGVFSSTKPQWQQIMLRVKDPKISVPFYEKHFGFKLLQKYDFDEWKFSVYFLGNSPIFMFIRLPKFRLFGCLVVFFLVCLSKFATDGIWFSFD